MTRYIASIEKECDQDYSIQQGSQLNGRRNKQFPREKKAERTHLHQTSPARHTKGTALRKGGKRVRERGTQVGRE